MNNMTKEEKKLELFNLMYNYKTSSKEDQIKNKRNYEALKSSLKKEIVALEMQEREEDRLKAKNSR